LSKGAVLVGPEGERPAAPWEPGRERRKTPVGRQGPGGFRGAASWRRPGPTRGL